MYPIFQPKALSKFLTGVYVVYNILSLKAAYYKRFQSLKYE